MAKNPAKPNHGQWLKRSKCEQPALPREKHRSPGAWCHPYWVFLTRKSSNFPFLGPKGRERVGWPAVQAGAWHLSTPGCLCPAQSLPAATPHHTQSCELSAPMGHSRGTGPSSHPAAAQPVPQPCPAGASEHPEQRAVGAWAALPLQKGFLPSLGQVLALGMHTVGPSWKTTNNQA